MFSRKPTKALATAGDAQPTQPPSQGTPYGSYAQPQSRPDPFTATYRGFDGSVSNQPNYAQRDAFINQITGQLGQMQSQSWQQQAGAPQFNFPSMWNQAGKMVEQGWQSPLAPLLGNAGAPHPMSPPSHGRPHAKQLGADLWHPPGSAFSNGVQSPSGYGAGVPGMPRTADWRDSDGDGVDDRDQSRPGGMPTSGVRNRKTASPRGYHRTL